MLEQQEIGIGDVIIAIVGYIPLVGPLASTIANAKTVVNSPIQIRIRNINFTSVNSCLIFHHPPIRSISVAAATSIKNAGGYAQITVTEYNDGTTTSVGGWTRYPYIYLHDLSAFDIRTTVFEEHDPFE